MKRKVIFKYIIEFLIAIFLFFLIISLILKFTIFNESYLLKKIEENNYYDTLYDNIQEEMSYYIVQSGLEKEVLNNIYTIDDIKKDVNALVKSFCANEKVTFDTLEIRNRLEQNILEYLTKNNIKISDEESLTDFVNKMIEVYEECINLSNGLSKISDTFNMLSNFLNYFIIITTIVLFLMIVYLWLLHRNNFGVSSLTVGILLILLNFLAIKYIDIENILFYSSEISNIIKDIVFNILNTIKYFGYAFIVYGIIASSISPIINKIRKK